jgi:hypothetical protein
MRSIDGAPKKPHLIVHTELPFGILEAREFLREYRTATGYNGGHFKTFYFCPKCNGWLEGWPVQYHQHTLVPHALAGRSGYVEDCERCGYELGFVGMVS